MKKILFLLSFIFFNNIFLFSQNKYFELFNKNGHPVVSRDNIPVKNGFITTINRDILKLIKNNNIPAFSSSFRYNNFRDKINIDLVQFDLLTDDFKVITSKKNNFEYEQGKYFTATTDDNTGIGTFSFYDDKFMGIIAYKNGNTYNLGQIKNLKNQYLIYKNKDFTEELNFFCDTQDSYFDSQQNVLQHKKIQSRSNKCINIYIEADYALFVENGKNIKRTVDYILGLFAETALLYKKEGINIKVSKIKIWETPDNYNTGSSNIALEQFSAKNKNSDTNLNMLLALGANGLGGIAYLNALCNRNIHFAYANININYRNVPLYSWSAMVITHELGHNLGSSHTHACHWNGNGTQIDDCGNIYTYNAGGTPEGNSCFDPDNPKIPLDGGTIMSYCHLVGAAGINLSKGFGKQPGDLIRKKVSQASCLNSCQGIGEKKPVADFEAENILTCEGGEVTFFDKSVNYPSDWIWLFETPGGTDTLYHKYPVMKYNSTGVYDVELIASNAKGKDTLKKMEYITVIEGPEANFGYEFINKDKIQFNNKSINSSNYFWKFGDGRISLLKNPKHKYKEGGKYLVELWAKKKSCNTENYFSDTIEIKIPFKAKFTYNTTKICKGDTVFFKVGENSFDSIKWLFEGTEINESSLEEIAVTYDSVGTFDVSMIAYSKYGSDTLSKNDLIKVEGKPQGDFVYKIKNDTVAFTNTFTGEYVWDFGDNSGSLEKNPVHIYSKDGVYYVRLVVKNTCDSSVLIKSVIINTTKLNENESNDLFVYPNPVKNTLFLVNNSGFDSNSSIFINDILGNTILIKNIKDIRKKGVMYQIDLRNMKKGIYFIKVKIKGRIFIEKIIID